MRCNPEHPGEYRDTDLAAHGWASIFIARIDGPSSGNARTCCIINRWPRGARPSITQSLLLQAEVIQ